MALPSRKNYQRQNNSDDSYCIRVRDLHGIYMAITRIKSTMNYSTNFLCCVRQISPVCMTVLTGEINDTQNTKSYKF